MNKRSLSLASVFLAAGDFCSFSAAVYRRIIVDASCAYVRLSRVAACRRYAAVVAGRSLEASTLIIICIVRRPTRREHR